MDLSGCLRRVAVRPLALVLAVGALAAGISASSVESAHSAGLYKDVELTVINRSKQTVDVSMCDGPSYHPANCPEFHRYALHPGKTAWRTHESVSGYVAWGDGFQTWDFLFSAQNPALDYPFIQLTPQEGGGGAGRWHLSEGREVGVKVDSFHVTLYRTADTSRVKSMFITINTVPGH
jgi:hypothetical protein